MTIPNELESRLWHPPQRQRPRFSRGIPLSRACAGQDLYIKVPASTNPSPASAATLHKTPPK